MNGNRDSELGLVIRGGKTVEKRTNNVTEKVSQKIYELRMNLFKEHFELDDTQAEDPLDAGTLQLIRQRVKNNT